MVARVGDVEVAGGVHRHSFRTIQGCRDRWSPIPAGAAFSGPRDGRDGSGGIYPANPVVFGVGDIESAGTIHSHALGDLLSGRSVDPRHP